MTPSTAAVRSQFRSAILQTHGAAPSEPERRPPAPVVQLPAHVRADPLPQSGADGSSQGRRRTAIRLWLPLTPLWLLLSPFALVAAPLTFLMLFAAKMVSKMVPLVPTVRSFNHAGHQGLYYSLMMSTGLTFGTISALFGLNHQIITGSQYSHLVATVIASAVVPTAIANAWFMPKHLLPKGESATRPAVAVLEDAGSAS